MLLLDTTSLQLCEFLSHAPAYATFSTKWEDGGVMQEDLCSSKTASQRPAFQVLQKACLECQRHDLQWLWNDSLCIDKTSKAALSESLNSIGEIYRRAKLCIVYLHDLLETETPDFDVNLALSSCSWLKHVWVLPHLIFSTVLHFYDAQWKHTGSKLELISELSDITSIDGGVLEDWHSLEDCSNSTKMSWAAGLSADRIEDFAYSLLAIFNINMPVSYGEGMNSFLRLQEQIVKHTSDYSLLAWRPRTNQQYRGILAQSPMEYSHLKGNLKKVPKILGNLEIQSDGVHIQAGLGGRGNDLLLPIYTPDAPTTWIVLTLWDGVFVRNCTETDINGNDVTNVFTRNICVSRDVDSGLSNRIALHRNGPDEKQVLNTGQSRRSSICDRMTRHGIASSHTAGSVDAVISDVAHSPTMEARGVQCFFGLAPRTMNCPRAHIESIPDIHSASRSGESETEGEESPSASPDSSGESSQPDLPGALEEGHPFSAVAGDITAIVIDRFLATCTSKPGKRALISWPRRSHKRPKLAWSDPYMDVELASDSEDFDTVVVNHAGARASTFACPFYLMDKDRHQTCLTRQNLSTIEDLKEHLWASHRRPNFCPICKETFATLRARDDHIRRRSCRQRDRPEFDGLTDGQIQQLARQGSPPLSRESQWYEIWNVVSPSSPRPLSPYYSSEREFRVVALRGFCETEGPTIISDFLREKGLLEWEVSNEERSLAILYKMVLHDAIDEVYRRFSGGTKTAGREQ